MLLKIGFFKVSFCSVSDAVLPAMLNLRSLGYLSRLLVACRGCLPTCELKWMHVDACLCPALLKRLNGTLRLLPASDSWVCAWLSPAEYTLHTCLHATPQTPFAPGPRDILVARGQPSNRNPSPLRVGGRSVACPPACLPCSSLCKLHGRFEKACTVWLDALSFDRRGYLQMVSQDWRMQGCWS